MRKVMLACVMVASLAACSWHRDRDRNMESSGASTPPAPHAQYEPRSSQGTAGNPARMDWSKCDEHPYTPGPRDCK
jgi:hypothetical protein